MDYVSGSLEDSRMIDSLIAAMTPLSLALLNQEQWNDMLFQEWLEDKARDEFLRESYDDYYPY